MRVTFKSESKGVTLTLSRPINKAFTCFTSGIISLILRNNQLSTLVNRLINQD